MSMWTFYRLLDETLVRVDFEAGRADEYDLASGRWDEADVWCGEIQWAGYPAKRLSADEANRVIQAAKKLAG